MPDHWIITVSADHIRRGVAGGFMQVNHGKRPPLARIGPGDGVVCYSPTTTMGKPDGLQSLTAIGTVLDRPIYTHDMGNGFVPHRRDVDWMPVSPLSIRPLLDRLDLTRGQKNWGYAFRFGVTKITATDFARIAEAFGVTPPATSAA
jgi:hypothetical protein